VTTDVEPWAGKDLTGGQYVEQSNKARDASSMTVTWALLACGVVSGSLGAPSKCHYVGLLSG
jgi:diacylglycerol kinase